MLIPNSRLSNAVSTPRNSLNIVSGRSSSYHVLSSPASTPRNSLNIVSGRSSSYHVLSSPRPQASAASADYSRQAAQWNTQMDSLDKKQEPLASEQLTFIRSQINSLTSSFGEMKSELADLKKNMVSKNVEGVVEKLLSAQDDHGKNNANLLDRVSYLEDFIGKSSEKHTTEMAIHQNIASEHRSTMEMRLEYLEGLIGDSANKHGQELAAHFSRLQDLHNAVAKCVQSEHISSFTKRLNYLEQFLGESSMDALGNVQKVVAACARAYYGILEDAREKLRELEQMLAKEFAHSFATESIAQRSDSRTDARKREDQNNALDSEQMLAKEFAHSPATESTTQSSDSRSDARLREDLNNGFDSDQTLDIGCNVSHFEGEVCIVTASERCTSSFQGEMHSTFTEVCITKIASPQRHNSNRTSKLTDSSPGTGAKRIDSADALAQVPTVLYKEPFTFSESGFLDDVHLRANASHQSGSDSASRNGASPFERERCCVEELPLPRRASPNGCLPKECDTSTDDVILDLSNMLNGLIVHTSVLGNSLDESLVGIDESFDGAPPSQRPQPSPSTIFFPR